MNYALINIGHTNRNPRHTRACFRILGFFDSIESAQSAEKDIDVDVFVVPVEKWILLAKTKDVDEMQTLNDLGRNYQLRLKEHDTEFQSNRAEQKTGLTTKRLEAAGTLSDTSIGGKVNTVPRLSEIRLQNYAVVSTINDFSNANVSEQQPAVLLWSAFDQETEARDYIKKQLSVSVKDVSLDVVALYEWLSVPSFEEASKITEEWRDEKLNEIMNSKKTAATVVSAYENECKHLDMKPAVIEISNEPATDEFCVAEIPKDPPTIDSTSCGVGSSI